MVDTGRSPYSIARPLHAVSAFIQYTRHVVWRAWVLLPYGCIMLTLSRVSLSEHRFTPICLSVPPLYRPNCTWWITAPCVPKSWYGRLFFFSQSINQTNSAFTWRLLKYSEAYVTSIDTFKKPWLQATFETLHSLLTLLYLSSDGRSFHTVDAEERKLRWPLLHTNALHEWVSEWVSSVLRPHQHSIGYTGDGF